MDVVECGGVQLDCTKLVQFIKRIGPSCSAQDIMNSNEYVEVLQKYCQDSRIKRDVYVDMTSEMMKVIVDQLVKENKVEVGFDPTVPPGINLSK